MKTDALDDLRRQWRASRRLRMAVLVACLVLGLDVVLSLAERRDAMGDAIARDVDLLARLEQASRDTSWPDRELEAQSRLRDTWNSIPEAGSEGGARAELQAWLSQAASVAGFPQAQVRVHDVLAVDGEPSLRQVLGRLAGELPRARVGQLLQALESGGPWVQVERLEVTVGDPSGVVVVVRGHYRTSEAGTPASDAQAVPLRGGAVP